MNRRTTAMLRSSAAGSGVAGRMAVCTAPGFVETRFSLLADLVVL
jgi:hypothetical protein